MTHRTESRFSLFDPGANSDGYDDERNAMVSGEIGMESETVLKRKGKKKKKKKQKSKKQKENAKQSVLQQAPRQTISLNHSSTKFGIFLLVWHPPPSLQNFNNG